MVMVFKQKFRVKSDQIEHWIHLLYMILLFFDFDLYLNHVLVYFRGNMEFLFIKHFKKKLE